MRNELTTPHGIRSDLDVMTAHERTNMASHLETQQQDDSHLAVRPRRRRTVVVTAAAIGVVLASIAVVEADSSPDTGTEQVARGSTWS